jgi:hypothetical protein
VLDKTYFTTKQPELLPHVKNFPGIGEVRIRKLSASEYAKDVLMWTQPDGKPSQARQKLVNLRVIQLAVCDENGEPLMTTDDLKAMAESMTQSTVVKLIEYIMGDSEEGDLGES